MAVDRKAAKQIYAYGKKRPRAQPSTADGGFIFYNETSWKDDMALAAAELYRATGKSKYLKQAHKYAARLENAYSFSWGDIHALAHYEIASVDASYVPTAIAFLNEDLTGMQYAALNNPFRAAVGQFFWGSASEMIGAALEALWYEKLSGDSQYRSLALAQVNYVLGANPWGVCWVNSVGTTWSSHPHHFVGVLTTSELVGFWNEGPLLQADWNSLGITLEDTDAYWEFQSSQAVYHDDIEDYATNEPTLTANAQGMALASLLAE